MVRRAIACLGSAAALAAFGLTWTWPPRPVPATAPSSEFSSGRARKHIDVIAERPHSIGTADHERVRAYVVAELEALGLKPEVQEAVGARSVNDHLRLGVVRNVVARRRATGGGSDKALLLMAHYDSRAMTPGASDDGFGTAALLETVRALMDQKSWSSDLIVLVTDGEEEGLLGATAFAAEHPWGRDVGAVLNIDARGNAGPALMFQTGDDNGALIRELGRAAPHLAANSLSQAIYRRMPNDTDLSVFLPRTPSLNFANVGGFERYHSPTDTAANIDEGTLQQDGEQMLGMARALLAHRLPLPVEPNATYFNVGPLFVRYPGALDLPLAVATAALLVGLVIVGARRGVLRPRAAALSALAALGAIVATAMASLAAWWIAARLHADYRLMNAVRPLVKDLYFTTFAALAVGIALTIVERLGRPSSANDGAGVMRRPSSGDRPNEREESRRDPRARSLELFVGAAFVYVVFALLMAIALPGASFPFTWPALVPLVIACGLTARAPAAGATSEPAPIAAVTLAAAPLVIVVPFIPQIYAAFGPLAGPAVGGMAALLAVACAPLARHLIAPSPRRIATGVLASAALTWVAANVVSPFDDAYPRPDTALYAVDGDGGHAFWLTPDPSPPSWCAQSFANGTRGRAPVPFPLADVLAAPAPDAKEPAPTITWLDQPGAPEDQARFRVIAPAGSELLALRIEGVGAATLDGRSLPVHEGVAAARYFAPPAAGVTVSVSGAAKGKLVVRAATHHSGLPAGLTLGQRPSGAMPKPGMLPPWDVLLESDSTLVAVSASR